VAGFCKQLFTSSNSRARVRGTLTDSDIVRLVGELDKRQTKAEAGKAGRNKQLGQIPSEVCPATGNSAEKTADLIGTSRQKVEKARAVLDKAAPEVKAAKSKASSGAIEKLVSREANSSTRHGVGQARIAPGT
jgi:hypothetical protein